MSIPIPRAQAEALYPAGIYLLRAPGVVVRVAAHIDAPQSKDDVVLATVAASSVDAAPWVREQAIESLCDARAAVLDENPNAMLRHLRSAMPYLQWLQTYLLGGRRLLVAASLQTRVTAVTDALSHGPTVATGPALDSLIRFISKETA